MAGARAKGYPQRVVRSSHALPLASALAIVAGGCGDSLDVSVDYRVVGLAPVTSGTCGAVPRTPPLATGATKVRFTFRDHTATGPGPLRCDVVLPRGGDAPVLAVPRKAEPVDLWVEYFTDAGALVARGQATDVDLTGGTVTIYTTDADGYACEPAQPTQPRAFHSATLLPTGEVLFLGGLTGPASGAGADFAPAAGAYVTASAELYDPGSGRVTPLVIAGLSPRAFHQVVVLGTDANGDVRLAVSGGLGVAGDATAAGNVAAIGGPLGEAPWGPAAVDAALGRAGAVPIAAELLTYSPSTRAVMRTPIVGASGAPGATGGQPDVEFATPRLIGGGLGAGGDVLDALTPTGEIAVSLPGVPRVGAAVVAATATSALWLGGDLAGTRLYDKIIQLDATPALTAGPAAPQPGVNRAFATAVRLDDEIIAAGGLRIVTGAISDTTGAVPGVRIDVATDVVTELPVGDFLGAAYMASAQLPRHGALISGGVVAGDLACLGTLACVNAQSVRYAADATARTTGAAGLARYGHRLTRMPDGTILVSGGFTRGAADGTIRAVAALERFEPHDAADDPLADVGPARAPGGVAEVGGVPVAPCAVVRGGPGPDASVDAPAIDAVEVDALDVDAM